MSSIVHICRHLRRFSLPATSIISLQIVAVQAGAAATSSAAAWGCSSWTSDELIVVEVEELVG